MQELYGPDRYGLEGPGHDVLREMLERNPQCLEPGPAFMETALAVVADRFLSGDAEDELLRQTAEAVQELGRAQRAEGEALLRYVQEREKRRN